jgi:uncharacterized protein YdiU (UPF0061 family)
MTQTEVLVLDDAFARELPELAVTWQASTAPAPRLLSLNERLASELGLDPAVLRSDEGVVVLVGNAVPAGSTPVAQAYAGHQFGGFNPQLGDGRALLLGELVDARGQRHDVHLKGSGRTPFSRGGDGKAAVGPMLREHVISEAMAALGIPTTRALAVVATGEQVRRETMLPGAVLCRVAASHLRVGSFQYAAGTGDLDLLRRLADHAIARHQPDLATEPSRHLQLLERVVEAQASLVARWMLVGFIHGVMNTDNMTISGETIDYGPCAFMDRFDERTVFSSIDHGGRYAYGNQPGIALWNLARLAEALLPLIDGNEEAAVASVTAVLETFPTRYEAHHRVGLQAKLGLDDGDHAELFADLFALLQANQLDFTSSFRALARSLRGDDVPMFDAACEPWLTRWRAALPVDASDQSALEKIAAAMDAVNPIYIPRNHKVEEALDAATRGDLTPFKELLAVVSRPFEERPGLDAYAEPAPMSGAPYRTFCGT